MNWLETLKTLAPTVASAFGGPLAGAAVTAIGEMLGVSEPTQEKIAKVIADGQLTGEQITAIRQLEMQYKNDEAERGFKYSELEFKDRDSARARDIATKDNVNRNLAYVVIGAFIAMVSATLLGYARVESALAGTLVGYLSAKCEQILAYYFGSTSGSARKTELLASSTPPAK